MNGPKVREAVVILLALLLVGLACWLAWGFFLAGVAWAAIVCLILWLVRRAVDFFLPLDLWPTE